MPFTLWLTEVLLWSDQESKLSSRYHNTKPVWRATASVFDMNFGHPISANYNADQKAEKPLSLVLPVPRKFHYIPA